MRKTALNNGFFLGIALILSSYVIYWANPSMFFQAKPAILYSILFLIFVKTGSEIKRAQNNAITLKEGFVGMFITGAIGVLMCTCFEYVHMNIIDPELREIKKEMELEAAETFKETMGEKYEEMMEVTIEQIENNKTVGLLNAVRTYFIRLLAPVAITALLIGLFIRKALPNKGNPPKKKEPENRYRVNK